MPFFIVIRIRKKRKIDTIETKTIITTIVGVNSCVFVGLYVGNKKDFFRLVVKVKNEN